MMEALACHPLGGSVYVLRMGHHSDITDTIKVRMQLSRRARAPGVSDVPNFP